jgi:6-phosphofructokinase
MNLKIKVFIKVIELYILVSFAPVCHFFGYQGRCAIPSRLDQNLSYTYGRISKNLIENNLTGFCPSVRGLTRPAKDWFPLAIPFTHLLEIKEKSN